MSDTYEDNFSFLQSISTLSKEVYNQLFELASIIQLKAGEKLIDANEIPKSFYVINSGVLRSFFTTEAGKEITRNIFTPISLVTSFASLLTQQPSVFVYEALTDCDIFEIDYKTFEALSNNNIELLRFHRKYLESLFMNVENMYIEVTSMDAKQRYLKLRERIPEIDNLIPQYQIASFLNISPVQLSRIRSKL